MAYEILVLPSDEAQAKDAAFAAFSGRYVGKIFRYKGLGIALRLTGGEWPSMGASFHHIVTRDGSSGPRRFDRDRAARVCWAADILEGDFSDVKIFEYMEGGTKNRVYFWNESKSYLLVLHDHESHYEFVTAHVVEAGRAEKLQKRYEGYLQSKKKAPST